MFPSLNRSLSCLFLPALLLLAAPPLALAKKKPALPEIFSTAQTVFVESKDGDITNLNLDRDQRDAILNVQDGVQDWGRYSLARSRHSADLILVVFKGRLDNRPLNGPTASIPGTSRTQPNRTPLPDPSQADNSPLGGSNDPNDPNYRFNREKDELRVYTLKPDGKFGNLLWNSNQEGGLNAPTLQLLRQLKSDVDHAYPTTPKKP